MCQMDPTKTLKTIVSIIIASTLIGYNIFEIFKHPLFMLILFISGFIALAYLHEEGKAEESK